MKQIMKELVALAALAVLAGCTGTGGAGDVDSGHDGRSPDGQVAKDEAGRKVDLVAAGFGDTVYFDYDKATLRLEALPMLKRIAMWMQQNPAVQLRIAGHADERGTREYNLALGERRAAAVRGYLASLGVPAQHVDTVSYGKERPVAVGSDETAWAKNRRAVAEIE